MTEYLEYINEDILKTGMERPQKQGMFYLVQVNKTRTLFEWSTYYGILLRNALRTQDICNWLGRLTKNMYHFTHEESIEDEFEEWSSQFAANVSEGLVMDLNKIATLLERCEAQK